MKAIRRFNVRTVLPPALGDLGNLSSNLRWSWHAPTRELFASMAPELWQQVGQDPVALLSSLSAAELDALAQDRVFVSRVKEATAELHAYLSEPRWYQRWAAEVVGGGPQSIAYFSAEFGLTEVLPLYSGGLGILAGDHLKSASDLGVPIVGVGLFYQSGYFAQSLNADGWQQETYPVLDPDGLPLALLREDGKPCVVSVTLPGNRVLRAYVWKAQVGRVPLLLLDSDVIDNEKPLRSVTDRLYGGGGEHRLLQEILLGMGGVRALRLYSRLTGTPTPDVYHANEGHAGFLGIERIHELVTQQRLSFDEALASVRAATVFTTHTPVPAGIDRFGADQIRTYFSGAGALDGVPVERLLALGAENYPGGDAGVFNMAVMGLRLAQRANGVSQLHGDVSRGMFEGLWPGFDTADVPISSVTNGVHPLTWVAEQWLKLSDEFAGGRAPAPLMMPDFAEKAPSDRMWAVKRELRNALVMDSRRRVRESWIKRGASPAELGWTESILDPDVLTIGFARRVPTYKRLTLMLRDPVRLRALLLDPKRPIQLIIAGKSHPADDNGKRLIQKMVRFADDPVVRHRVVFLPNYDIGMARVLYPGCDVWLNNPLRPLEACGTSGMKAALNGGLNLSILDGWWDEWYDGENGWAIPTADGVNDPDRRDDLEAAALYDLIERNVVDRFYDVDADGLPQRWLAMVRHTLATLGPKVLATRMVRDYTGQLYVPAAHSGWAANAKGFELAKDIAAYRGKVSSQWSAVRVENVDSQDSQDSQDLSDAPQVGDKLHVRSLVALGQLSPDDVTVQIVYGRASEADQLSDTETADLRCAESYDGGRHRFEGVLEISRTGSFGYSVRVLPRHRGLASPAELGLVVNA
ncbi:MAG TPA: alpha-glucan family phosphorylase [Dermatophilaceae bacterium]|nr:alpha-glucan family phosphorylase [Dermatophilaceae bacterium]